MRPLQSPAAMRPAAAIPLCQAPWAVEKSCGEQASPAKQSRALTGRAKAGPGKRVAIGTKNRRRASPGSHRHRLEAPGEVGTEQGAELVGGESDRRLIARLLERAGEWTTEEALDDRLAEPMVEAFVDLAPHVEASP